jgi:hypothetical protein
VQLQHWGGSRLAAAATAESPAIDSDVDDLEDDNPVEAIEPQTEASDATEGTVRGLLPKGNLKRKGFLARYAARFGRLDNHLRRRG